MIGRGAIRAGDPDEADQPQRDAHHDDPGPEEGAIRVNALHQPVHLSAQPHPFRAPEDDERAHATNEHEVCQAAEFVVAEQGAAYDDADDQDDRDRGDGVIEA